MLDYGVLDGVCLLVYANKLVLDMNQPLDVNEIADHLQFNNQENKILQERLWCVRRALPLAVVTDVASLLSIGLSVCGASQPAQRLVDWCPPPRAAHAGTSKAARPGRGMGSRTGWTG